MVKKITWGFGLVVAGLAVLANLKPSLFLPLWKIPGVDKTAHFALVGALTFLANLSWAGERTRLLSFPVQKGSLLVFAIVTLEEVSQRLFPARRFDLEDLLFGYLGLLVFDRLAAGLSARRARASC